MPDIDTSPAALRALADYWGSSEPLGLDPRDGSLAEQLLAETERRMTQIVATLRAIAAEKEAATVKPGLTVGVEAESEAETKYLLLKRGLYWRFNSQGYTAIKDEAQRYTHTEVGSYKIIFDVADARPDDYSSVFAVPESLGPSYLPAGFSDVISRHASTTIDSLRARLAAAEKERDEALRDAIEFTQKVDAGLVRDEEYLRLHREKMEQYDRRVVAEARAEKAEAERDAAWRTGYKACVDTVLSYEAHYYWGPMATAQNGADVAMQAIKDCVVRSAERAGVIATANPEDPAHD